MFLKKRHHADIMARLHSSNNNITSNSDSSVKMEIVEDSDDSGFGSDLIIDEDFDEGLEINSNTESNEQDVHKIEEDGSLKIKNGNERVSVIKHTCDLSRGIVDEKENVLTDGCCTKMNSIIGK